MYKVIKLIYVSSQNNNKFYNMLQPTSTSSQFTVEYGRVGVTTQTTVYPMKRWDAVYREKLKKGYKDITDLTIEEVITSVPGLDLSNLEPILALLVKYSSDSVRANYKVAAENVTQAQINKAQQLIDELTGITDRFRITHDLCLYGGTAERGVNDVLLDLYTALPRTMKNVQKHLVTSFDLTRDFEDEVLEKLILKEQDLLDSMQGQVSQLRQISTKTEDKLTSHGLLVETPSPKEVLSIEKLLTKDSLHRLSEIYKIINPKTQEIFDAYLVTKSVQVSKLLFHGSRNENWWSILQNGLKIRPSNAIITGAMFGHGIYFAPRAKKSINYTSLHGSYWARGSSNEAFLALYDVHYGNALKVKEHTTELSSMNKSSLDKKGGYDCVHALAGTSLYNDEIITYDDRACTIKYLIKLKDGR